MQNPFIDLITFDINPDIRRAETLASEFYTDEKYFEESKEKIFARSWQFVGKSGRNKKSQAFYTILENFLDEPVLITQTTVKISIVFQTSAHIAGKF